MKECTFKPKIKSYITKSQKTLNEVNFIDNFIRIKENKKKKIQEQKEIEEKLFHLEKRYDQRTGQKITRVEEFQLSKPNAKIKQELKSEQLKQIEKECPFKPNINKKGEKAPLINKIIY